MRFFLEGPHFTYREKRRTHTAQHPIPKGNSKVARVAKGLKYPLVTEGPRVKAGKKALTLALLQHAPLSPFTAVRLDVSFVFVPPKAPMWRHEACLAGYVQCDRHSHGDRDNLHKMLADCLEAAGFLTDDCMVTQGDVKKTWGPVRGFDVKLTQLASVQSAAEWREVKEGLALASNLFDQWPKEGRL